MLSSLIIFGLGLTAFYLTLTRGAVHTFAVFYLPALILLSYLPAIALPFLPDATTPMAVGYGILFAWVLRGGEPRGFTWHPIDTLVILLAISTVITKISTEVIYTGVSEAGQQFFNFFLPYYLGRMALARPDARYLAVKSIAFCAIGVSFFALIETRLWPYFLSRTLEGFGLMDAHNTMTLGRWGLFRSQTLFAHPIDQGNAGVLMGSLLLVLGYLAGRSWKDKWVLSGFICSGILLVTSLSFTSYLAALATVAAFVVLLSIRVAYMLLVPGVVLAILVGISFTTTLINVDPGPRPGPDTPALAASLWMRTVIVQRSWEIAQEAGMFGFGNLIPKDRLNLDSVDNSYILFLMTRGWVFLVLFLTLPVILAFAASRGLARAGPISERLPMAAGVAGIFGTLGAMYTVWFGFTYAILLMITLGLTVSMIQVLMGRQPAVIADPAQAQGLPVGQPGGQPSRGLPAGGVS